MGKHHVVGLPQIVLFYLCLSQCVFEGTGNKMLFLLYPRAQQNLQVQYTPISCWEMHIIFACLCFQYQLNLLLKMKDS